jgi:hypothetical protein
MNGDARGRGSSTAHAGPTGVRLLSCLLASDRGARPYRSGIVDARITRPTLSNVERDADDDADSGDEGGKKFEQQHATASASIYAPANDLSASASDS